MIQMTVLGGGRIVSFSSGMLLQIFCMVLGILLLSALTVWTAFKIRQVRGLAVAVVFFSIISFVASNLVYAWASANLDISTTAVYEKIPFSQPLRMNKRLAKWGLVDKEKISQKRIKEENHGEMNYPLHPLSCNNREGFNVLFIFVDALRYDMLSKEVMPYTFEFSKNNVRFLDHYSNGNHTRDGVFSLFTGLPAQYWGRSLASQTPSILTTAFLKQGYEVGIFTGAPLDMPAFNKTIFSTVPNLVVYPPGKNSVESDALAVDNFENWQSNLPANKRFFSFVFFDSVYSYSFPEEEKYTVFKPYLKSINHLELNNSYDPSLYLAKYKNAAHYVDSLIKKILDYLKEKDLLKSTIVVISSDHGEEFNDNKLNYWGHGGNFTDSQVKVPMVIHWPGKKETLVEYPTSHLDLVPTLLPEVLGCTNPTSDYSVGQSLWEKDRRRNWIYVHGYTRGGFVEKDRIVRVNKAGALEFLDKSYRPTNDKTIPSYLQESLQENARYSK